MVPNSQLSQHMRGGTYKNETVHDNKLSCWINVLATTFHYFFSEASHNLRDILLQNNPTASSYQDLTARMLQSSPLPQFCTCSVGGAFHTNILLGGL